MYGGVNMRFVELLAKGEIVRFDEHFEPASGIDESRLVPVSPILGAGDVELEVPKIGKSVTLPGAHEGWTVTQLPKEPRARSGEGDEDYIFRVEGGSIERIIRFNDVFTNAHEEDYNQKPTGFAYLGIGGVALVTDEQELRCLLGPTLEHEIFFDLGYWSSEHVRAYSSHRALDHVRSFTACGHSYIIVDNLNSANIIRNADYPLEAQGKYEPRWYPIFNIDDGKPRKIGSVTEHGEWERKEERDPTKLGLLFGSFSYILPVEIANVVWLLHSDEIATSLYRVEGTGKDESLVKVRDLPFAADQVAQVRVVDLH